MRRTEEQTSPALPAVQSSAVVNVINQALFSNDLACARTSIAFIVNGAENGSNKRINRFPEWTFKTWQHFWPVVASSRTWWSL